MELKMKNLINCFNTTNEQQFNWVAVLVKNINSEGEELIINPYVNFDDKLEYYQKAYTDDLVLKTYNGIKIVGFTFGNTLEDIENQLFK
jgi:hypothetical protein